MGEYVLKYENEKMIQKADQIATQILNVKRTNHHRDKFFPLLIDNLQCNVGVEVGVDKAGFSNHILSKSKIKKYYCVDTWQDNFGSDYKPNYYEKDGNKRYNQAKYVLDPYLIEGRAKMLRMTGVKASMSFLDESIDFCYIDGDHSLEGIYMDIKSWMPKIKIGGIISGHDYKDGPKSGMSDYWGQQLDFCVETVVNYYCQKYGHKLNVVGGRIKSWWFVKNSKTFEKVKFCE